MVEILNMKLMVMVESRKQRLKVEIASHELDVLRLVKAFEGSFDFSSLSLLHALQKG